MLSLSPFTFIPLLAILIYISLLLHRRHLLMMLLLLEAVLVTIMLLVPILMSSSSLLFLIILLSFGACEASLGLSLLVALSQKHGADNLNLLTSNKW